MQNKLVIGVSKLAPNYNNWLLKLDSKAEVFDLFTLSQNDVPFMLRRVHGFVLSGGCDVHPMKYGKPGDLPFCKNVDERRDELELDIIRFALKEKVPLFGICRGQQILNVYFKGTLYPELTSGYGEIIRHVAEEDVYHEVTILPATKLFELTGVRSGWVNSSHHQAVCTLGNNLRTTAHSNDMLIEALEMGSDHPFCMAVQWHPERMELSNPLSGKIGKAFINAAMSRKQAG